MLPLDTSMTLTDSAMCKQKCEEAMMETGEIRNDTGCCWLKSGEGCSLKERSKAIHGGTAIAMTCRKGKKKIRAVVNISYHIYTYGKVKRIFLVFLFLIETCNDGIKNNNEREIDCGGPCSACGR